MKGEDKGNPEQSTPLTVLPLTKARWNDFTTLFGEQGACEGCWCMFWRLRHKEYQTGRGEINRDKMKSLVERGVVPGLIGYLHEEPIAWISLAPREEYIRLETSKILSPVDESPNLWSIVCLFIAKPWRRKGYSVPLIRAAVQYAFSKGAKVVEAYPFDIEKKEPDSWVFTGIAKMYRSAGFEEVLRRSPRRPIMRFSCS